MTPLPAQPRPPRTFTLGQLIFGLSALFLALSLFALAGLFVHVREQAVSNLAREDARKTSMLVFETLYAAMRRGWSQSDIRDIVSRLNNVEPRMTVRVFRGWPVIRQYGDVDGESLVRAGDDTLTQALSDGRERLLTDTEQIRYIYPVLVQEECRVCHIAARVGEVNGVIDVRFPVSDVKVSFDFVSRVVFGYIIVALLLMALAVYWALRRLVADPVAHASGVIKEVTHSADLSRSIQEPSRIREVEELTRNFNQLLAALNDYNAQLKEYSIRDPLTGLYNRRKFESFLDFEVARSRRSRSDFALLMIDLDNFKYINDTFGHPIGDLALKELGRMIQAQVRTTDMAARLGGDEFAIILPETDREAGLKVANKLRDLLMRTDLSLPVGNFRIQASFGLVMYPANGETATDLFTAMDVAMYKAKREGRNRVASIEAAEQSSMMEIFNRGQHLRRALEEDRIAAALQPIVRTSTGDVHAYEVLARLRDETGVQDAGEFIETAYQIGMIEEVDLRVFEKALAAKRTHGLAGVRMFFNLSSRTFSSEARMRALTERVAEAGVPPGEVVFEITEREALPHIARLRRLTQDLREEGYQFALDDFGSGFSSFLYLKYLHVDYVKIEGNFIRSLVRDPRDRVMVEHIHSLARRFGLRTIAEFVEDEAVHEALRSIGIDYGQGYFYGAPQMDLGQSEPEAV